MKRLFSLILIAAMLTLPVLAEDTWVCPGCGATVDAKYAFCPWCAHPSVMPEPTAEPEDWLCTRCGNYVEAAFPFCPYCAGPKEETGLKDGEWFCGNCQRVNKGGFCGKCGKSREEAAVTPPPKPTPEPIPESTPVPEYVLELQAMKNAKVGEYVTYGHYPQTTEGNDSTPIEWLVLDVQGDKALLLSRYGLDAKPYNEKNTAVTWETCTLRTWLNGEFLNRAFSADEQKGILTTNVDNKVFLLNYAEANRYLGVTRDDINNTKSRVAPTAYAKKNGAWTTDKYKTADGEAAGFWWLRSPGDHQLSAANVDTDGSLGNYYVHCGSYVVRPALWIDLGSDIF